MDPVPTATDIAITVGITATGSILAVLVSWLRRPAVRPRHARRAA